MPEALQKTEAVDVVDVTAPYGRKSLGKNVKKETRQRTESATVTICTINSARC